ncbi:MAG: hypothetical protein FJ109_12550 [Deltaproteobacteria bacterium]|nr:hypothetical protein [Deltaproteobacteria bacterium]
MKTSGNARVGQFEAGGLEMLVLKAIEDSGRRFVLKGTAGTRPIIASLNLETRLLQYLGHAVKVDFVEADEETPESIAANRKRQRKDQKAKREKELRELPLVKDAVDILQGRISVVKVQEPD